MYDIGKQSQSDYLNYLLQPKYTKLVDDNGNSIASDYVELANAFGSGNAVNGLVAEEIAANSALKSVSFNLLESLYEGIENINTLNLRPFVNINAKIYKGFSYKGMFQYELANRQTERYDDVNSYMMRMAHNALVTYNSTNNTYTANLPTGGRYYQFNQKRYSYTFRQQLDYNGTFGNNRNHHLSAIAGFEMRQTNTPRTLEQLRYGYDPVTLSSTTMDWASISQTGYTSYLYGTRSTLGALSRTQSEILHRYVSLYSNAGYTFKNLYSITGSIRVDQADLFGVDPAYKYRPLWSVGASWNISNESFMQPVQWLNGLKARFTYGINGNVDQTSSPFLTARRRNDNLYNYLQYIDIVNLPNPKLRWEKTATTNFGIDFAVLDSRIVGSVDLYNRYSSDLLVTTDLDPTVGASSRVLNNGALLNRGVEVSLSSEWLRRNDFSLSSQLVFAKNKNTIKKVNNAGTTAYSYVASPSNYFFEGTAYNSLYAYKFSEMVNGYPVFLDQNGEPNIIFDANNVPTSIKDVTSPEAIVNMGSLTPLYNGSFTQRIRYKSLELGAMFIFAGGHKLRKDVTSLSSNDVVDEDIAQRWTAQNTESNLPRLMVDYPQALVNYASTLSTLWANADVNVLSANYVKLRNIILSYYLPEKIARKAWLSSAKISAQINNLWLWSAAGDDIDPEAFSLNSGTRNLPIPKSFLIGLSLNF